MERDTTQEVDTVEEEVVDREMEEAATVVVVREMKKWTEELLLRRSETVLSSHRWASKDRPLLVLQHLSILSLYSLSLIFVLNSIIFVTLFLQNKFECF